ncbi:MAG: PAS domain-containing protein [Myxococcales bacterium FL481]|nr:MAG: PAS domain-containing protein [Myxococcales bacterium FL481]
MGNDRYHDLVQSLPEALVVCQQGRIAFVNNELRRLLGWPDGCSPVDRPLSAIVPGTDMADFETILASASNVGESAQPHLQKLQRRDGTPVHGRLLARSIDWNGDHAVLLLVHPLPASNRPPELLSLLETAVDHLSDMIMITEADSLLRQGRRIIYVNKAFCRTTGFEPEEVIGKTPNLTIGPETDDAALEQIAEGLSARKSVKAELLKYRKDRSKYHVELEIVPVFDSEGKHSHWVSVHRDISERKRMQATLASTERLAALGRLAAGVGHEINNPLAYLVSNLVYAVDGLGDLSPGVRMQIQPVLEALAEARDGAERVRNIVRDLKQLSAGATSHPGPAVLSDVLRSTLSIARSQLRGRARVTVELGDVPALEISEHRLGQVLLNLLLNAVEAMSPDDGVGDTIVVRGCAEGEYGVVEVEDNGPGIDPQISSRIFDPFFTTKVGSGTGLGLSICHSIITSAGGTIEVESQPGRGSLFRVRVPTAALPANSPPPVVARPAASSRVLVVDDEPLVLRSLERTLSRDHRVTTASSARRALACLEHEQFDVVLFDIMMPEMTGMELFRHLEVKHPRVAERVVFITGGAVNDEVSSFLASCSKPFLEKPYDPGELRRLVGSMVQ